jgi:uncharacterized protein with ParB-like and HNH nuclease domain/predicted transport protein
MKATEVNFLKFLKQPNQFVIPIYQRTYSWTLKQCQQLWADLLKASEEEVSGHFVGSIVYIEGSLYQVASVPQLLVIDGQQRLTTLSLFLSALAKVAEELEVPLETTRKKIESYFLFNNEEEGDDRYKLLLTQGDRETFIRLIENRELPADPSKRILENYQYFENQLRKSDTDINAIYLGISKLIIVNISLERDRDNPQLIFESLNSTGLDLSQADLIRNYVLMGLPPSEQEKVYKNYWYPMEQIFQQENQTDLFDRFMRDYLTLKSRSGAIPNIRDVYTSFKTYVQRQKGTSVSDIMADVYRYSKHYANLVLNRERDEAIRQALHDINTLRVDVAYPFLLEVYEDYAQENLRHEDFIRILRLIESYVFRRSIAGVPTNSMNKTFATLSREIDREHYIESLELAFTRKDGYRRFPDDDEFQRELLVKDIYNFRNRGYLLRKLENYKRTKELVDPENYTVEHILPQNPKLSLEWQQELGPNWKEIQAKYLHTIGNLTLTAYNSEYSDRLFAEKRDMQDGFKVSPLYLNHGIAQLEHWREAEIQHRATVLADWAVNIWPAPDVAAVAKDIDVHAMLRDIFSAPEDLEAAKTYVQEVVDLIGYDKIEHILAITYRNDRAISINLGQWLILGFRQRDNSLQALFALDFEFCSHFEGLEIHKIEAFSSHWAGDRDIRLVRLRWDKETKLPELFLQAWKSAILHAYQVFKGWSASSYMNYHLPELAQVLVAETARSRHAEYLQGDMLILFEALRKRILNLDDSVREEFKKLYIAYKTSTNFVDIVPQKSRLRLSLNMRFDEIKDPQGLCRDVTDLGRWGNGDVEIGISNMEQLDNVMLLIQQAFNKHCEEILV